MSAKCIIIEDEPLAMEQTKEYVNKVPYLNLLDCFDNGLDAIGFLKSNEVDLMFLDIQMDDLSGIQLLEALPNHPKVIVTTAFEKYALKGYEFKISDFLLKPFTFGRFLQAVERAHSDILKEKEEIDYIFIKTEYRLEKIFLDDIAFIEGMRDYRRIHLANKKIMTLQTFSEFERVLPSKIFCRVHKSYIVSLQKIESIEKDRIRIKGCLIPISDTYRDNFYKKIHR
jgi:two-component system, LytTR family, response regulator